MFNINLNGNKKIDGMKWNQMDSIYLEKAEFTEISTAVIEVAEEEFTLIDGAFPTVTADPNKKQYEYTTLDEVGDAKILQKPSDYPAMSVNGTTATVKLPWKGIGFELQKEDIANSRRLGEKLDTLHARIAAKKVRKLQDEALYSLSSAFGTLGVYGQATGTFAGTNWTTTTTNIYDQIRQIMDAVPVARRTSNGVLILHADQLSELYRDTLDNGTAMVQVTGGSFAAKVKEAWPQLRIISSQWVTATEAIFYPFDEEVVRRVMSVPVRVIDWDENPMEVQMVALARDVLVVPTPTAVIKITGI